ncbi:FAD-dependent monooxygenase, partial [Pseudomonas syringae group genomosp. 7]|uniref:FAD-dependent monooxygenase n=1 Tax=Pseudomonas syringae group genomosp. 7 TaxID=251699 RepID=UPI0037700B94
MATSSRLDVQNPPGPRVVIIGAGPAGTRRAETLVAAGIKPILIDEHRRDGGQI